MHSLIRISYIHEAKRKEEKKLVNFRIESWIAGEKKKSCRKNYSGVYSNPNFYLFSCDLRLFGIPDWGWVQLRETLSRLTLQRVWSSKISFTFRQLSIRGKICGCLHKQKNRTQTSRFAVMWYPQMVNAKNLSSSKSHIFAFYNTVRFALHIYAEYKANTKSANNPRWQQEFR